jgi:beta-lactam-binding protein with PASTA domain
MTKADATKTITGAGLKVGAVTWAHSAEVAAGSVISQDPPGGMPVDEGFAVDLVISSGPLSAPDVTKMTKADATKTITRAGLKVGAVAFVHRAKVAADSVISQDPPSKTPVDEGSAMDLVISSGPVRVIDVTTMTLAEAIQAITGASLKVGAVAFVHRAKVAADSVVSQDPPSGTPVEEGSAVDLVISSEPLSAPDVTKMTEADATKIITGAGLKVGAVASAHSAKLAVGSVISQGPPSGTPVDEGSAMDLVISSGPLSVIDVTTMTLAEAIQAITGASLEVGAVASAHSAKVPAGSVISQDPPSRAPVDEDSAVDLVISSGPLSVPDVTKMTEADASKTITGAGLKVGAVTWAHSAEVATDSVISQDPPSKTPIDEGSAVDLVISSGPLSVPDVTKMTLVKAIKSIIGASLKVGNIAFAHSAKVAANSVASQDPPSRAPVDEGSAVNLVISLGRRK